MSNLLEAFINEVLKNKFVLSKQELAALEKWTWHSSSQRALSAKEIQALKELGNKQKAEKFKIPAILYRAIKLNDTTPDETSFKTFASGFKSWSKSQAGALHYVQTNRLSGLPVNSILYKWSSPTQDKVFIDFDSLEKLSGVTLNADKGEYAAEAKNVQIVSIQSEVIRGKNGNAKRWIVEIS